MSAYFDSYECFDDEKKANDIVADALKKLKAEMTDKAKALVQEYRMAEAEKARLTREIGKLKEEASDMKAYYERLTNTNLPLEFIQNMARAVCSDYAPGDKAWIVENHHSAGICPNCQGLGKVKITYVDNGKRDEIQCPRCNGRKALNCFSHTSKEARVTEVNLKLCFDSHGVRYWDTDCIKVSGCSDLLNVKDVYKTKEDADKAIKDIEDKENYYEVD